MESVRLIVQKYLGGVLSKRSVRGLCVWGEPGVGKTHLLQTLLQATPCRSFSLSASALETDFTTVFPGPADPSPELARDWEAVARGETLEPKKRVRLLAALLVELAPVLLHLENLHAASQLGRAVVEGLAQVLPRLKGVGLIVCSRSPQPEPLQNLELPRLNHEASAALMRANLIEDLPEEGLEWIHSRALGNPLFGLEYLRYLSRQGFFWSDSKRWHWRNPPKEFVPPTLEALVYKWMHRYAAEPSARQALEVRAMLPESADDAIWAGVAGLEPEALRTVVRGLEQVGMLRQGQLFHPLVGGVLHKELGAAQRRAYAAKALPLLKAARLEPSADLIAEANLGQAQTLQTYQRLAVEAKARGEAARAGHWLGLAAEQTRETALALEAARLLRHTDLSRAIQLAQTAAYTPPHDPEAVYLCAELWVIRGDFGQSETLLGLLPPEERRSQRWWETLIRLRYTRHTDYDEVLRLWGLHPVYHPTAHPETVVFVCAVLGQRGQFEAAFELSRPLLQRVDLEPYLRCRVLEMYATFHHLMGQPEQAGSFSAEAVEMARGLGRPAYLAQLLRKEGIYAENLNQAVRALRCHQEAVKLLAEHGSTIEYASAQATLAALLAERGGFEEAEGLFVQALTVLDGSDNQFMRANTRNLFALLYLDWQLPYGAMMALKHATMALEIARGLGNQQVLHAALTTLAMAESHGGNPQRALELAREAEDERHVGPSAVRRARGQYALGLALEACGQPVEAAAALSESVQAHEAMGFIATAHRFGLELDRLTGDMERARERVAWLEAQGLLGGVQLARKYFPHLAPTQAEARPAEPDRPCLCLLGPTALQHEQGIEPYRGRKRVELLAYLAEARAAGRDEVPTLELTDALYPGMGEVGAKAILKQLVYLMRNQLGATVISSTISGYALGALDTDIERFLRTQDTALWRGLYLEGLGEGWHPEVREALLDKLRVCASELLRSSPTEALRLGEVWQRMEPYDKQALETTLRALEVLGDGRRQGRIYQQAAARFREVGEALPALPAFLIQATHNL